MVLSSRVRDVCECTCGETATVQIPGDIRTMFDEELVLSGDKRRLFVTLGQFSIIRLERDAQLVVPVLEYSLPTKECCDTPGCAEDPCEMFSRIPFPASTDYQRLERYSCDRQSDTTAPGCSCYQTT